MIATVTLNPSLDEWMELPSLRVGRLNRATGFARYPGGKGINVSRVIHELGGATMAYALAGGEDGLILRELLNRFAIRHAFVTVAGTTRNNYKIRTRTPPRLTEINLAGPPVSRRLLQQLQRRLLASRPLPRCVVLSGSLPPGAPAWTYRRWIAALRRRQIPSVLDASGEAMRQGIAASPWLIKPNRQEAEELLGQRLASVRTLVAAVRSLLQRGPATVILSLGADGALLTSSTSRAVWLARPPAVKPATVVGAGDSLVGGFLWAWGQRLPLLEAFRWGIASGTAAALTSGTALCRRADVRRLVPRVKIRQVA